MASQYKINRAYKLSHQPLPQAQAEIQRTLDSRPELLDTLTSRRLAAVIDLLDAHWQRGAAHKEQEICAEGYAWDARQSKPRELAD